MSLIKNLLGSILSYSRVGNTNSKKVKQKNKNGDNIARDKIIHNHKIEKSEGDEQIKIDILSVGHTGGGRGKFINVYLSNDVFKVVYDVHVVLVYGQGGTKEILREEVVKRMEPGLRKELSFKYDGTIIEQDVKEDLRIEVYCNGQILSSVKLMSVLRADGLLNYEQGEKKRFFN